MVILFYKTKLIDFISVIKIKQSLVIMSNVFVADVPVPIKKQFNIRFLYFKFKILFLYNAKSDVHQGQLSYKFTLYV